MFQSPLSLLKLRSDLKRDIGIDLAAVPPKIFHHYSAIYQGSKNNHLDLTNYENLYDTISEKSRELKVSLPSFSSGGPARGASIWDAVEPAFGKPAAGNSTKKKNRGRGGGGRSPSNCYD